MVLYFLLFFVPLGSTFPYTVNGIGIAEVALLVFYKAPFKLCHVITVIILILLSLSSTAIGGYIIHLTLSDVLSPLRFAYYYMILMVLLKLHRQIDFEKFTIVFAFSLTAYVIYQFALAQYAGWNIFLNFGWYMPVFPGFNLLNPNDLGFYLSYSSMFLFLKRKNLVVLLMLFLNVLLGLLTGQKTGYIIPVLIFLAHCRYWLKSSPLPLYIIIFVGIYFIFSHDNTFSYIIDRVIERTSRLSSFTSRSDYLLNALKLWSRDFTSFIFGPGALSYQAVYDIMDPHNAFAEVFLTTGIFGIFFIVTYYFFFLRLLKTDFDSLILLVSSIILSSATGSNFLHILPYLFLFILYLKYREMRDL